MKGVCLLCGGRFDTDQQLGFVGCLECGDSEIRITPDDPDKPLENRLSDLDAKLLKELRIKL